MNELHDLACRIAGLGAAYAERLRRDGVSVAATKSSRNDVVTLADQQTEQLIRDELAKARPSDGFYGEESTASTGSSGLTWVVDPIDGTVNYLYGIPQYAVSVAVVEGDDPAIWQTLAACVTAPALGEAYAAARGEGATRNGRPLSPPPPLPLAEAMLATGFSYRAEQRSRQAAVLQRLIAEVRDVRRIGSAALDLCAVAAGSLDLYYESGLHPYDYVGGALIAREAGARVAGPDGARESEDLVLACNPALYAEFSALLASARQE